MRNRMNIDLGLLILRIAIGGLMFFHGFAKLQSPMNTANHMVEVMNNNGLPGFLGYGVFLGEVIAPLVILIGWRTKLFAPLIAITMLVAVFTRHAEDIWAVGDRGGLAIELQALYLLGALALTCTGAGKFAASYKNKFD